MNVEALGGPYDGNIIVVPDAIRNIRLYVEPDYPWPATNGPPVEIPLEALEPRAVTYKVIRWYTGKDDQGNDGRMINIVLAPDHWPKNPSDETLYPPWTP
jgi:hypothetical protein